MAITHQAGSGTSTSKRPPPNFEFLKRPKSYVKSVRLLDEALRRVPNGSQTFSKSYTQFPVGAAPLFLERAQDCFVWDVDGNGYLDYMNGIGPVTLGHSRAEITRALKDQLDRLVCPSLTSELEVRTAARLIELSPDRADGMVRFGKNGSDVTSGAVKVARAFTKRDKIVCGGYHGWHDWYIATTTRDLGIPDVYKTLSVACNVFDFEKLETHLKTTEFAAVILEPMSGQVPTREQHQKLIELCHRYGTLVIFDECWTGFRVDRFSAAAHYGVRPDLSCFAKGCANGYPVSFLIGRAEIMNLFNEAFFSFTFGGDALGFAALNAVLDFHEQHDVVGHLKAMGEKLMGGVRESLERHGLTKLFRVDGYAQKPLLTVLDDKHRNVIRSLTTQHFAENGILFGGYHVLSYAHREEHIDYTLAVYESFFQLVGSTPVEGLSKLVKGRVVEDVFRKH